MPKGVYKRTFKHRKAKMGKNNPMFGKTLSKNHRNKISIALKGKYIESKSKLWKGEKVGYSALHYWIRKYLEKPKYCCKCGKVGKKNGRNWNIHWANKSQKYKRDKSDWFGLCSACHVKYDKKTRSIKWAKAVKKLGWNVTKIHV